MWFWPLRHRGSRRRAFTTPKPQAQATSSRWLKPVGRRIRACGRSRALRSMDGVRGARNTTFTTPALRGESVHSERLRGRFTNRECPSCGGTHSPGVGLSGTLLSTYSRVGHSSQPHHIQAQRRPSSCHVLPVRRAIASKHSGSPSVQSEPPAPPRHVYRNMQFGSRLSAPAQTRCCKKGRGDTHVVDGPW